MRRVIFVSLSCLLYSQALECGFKRIKKIDIENTLSACVKNNETLYNILEMTSSPSAVTASPKGQSDSDEEGTTSISQTIERGSEKKKSRRTRRASRNSKTAIKDTGSNTNDNNSEEDKAEETTHSSEEFSDKCIVQCMLKELDLTDDRGKPDQKKIIDGVTKNISGRELKNFLQKTLDDCFELLEKESDLDSCDYSSEFVSCLAEEGRSNCADWPAGSLPV